MKNQKVEKVVGTIIRKECLAFPSINSMNDSIALIMIRNTLSEIQFGGKIGYQRNNGSGKRFRNLASNTKHCGV